jgi:hypothetical protein
MSIKFKTRYMELIQAFKLAIKGFTSRDEKVFLVVLKKHENEVIDVTNYSNQIKEIIDGKPAT